MIATPEQPRCVPADRDLEIYSAVRVDGRRQVDVAAEYGITQGRVSQIVRRVNRWRAGMGAEAELERRDRQSVDRWLDIQRIEKLYEEAMELYRRSCQPRKKERRGKNRGGEWSMESLDHQPGNLQCLKFAARLLELKSQLDQQAPPSPRALEAVDEEVLFQRLAEMRVWAEERGEVTPEHSPADTTERMLNNLLGPRRHQPRPVRQPEDLLDEEEAAAAANAPASISNISAVPPAEESVVTGPDLAVTDCPAATSDEPSALPAAPFEPGSGANNSAVFAGSGGPPEPEPRRNAAKPKAPTSGRRDCPTGVDLADTWGNAVPPCTLTDGQGFEPPPDVDSPTEVPPVPAGPASRHHVRGPFMALRPDRPAIHGGLTTCDRFRFHPVRRA